MLGQIDAYRCVAKQDHSTMVDYIVKVIGAEELSINWHGGPNYRSMLLSINNITSNLSRQGFGGEDQNQN